MDFEHKTQFTVSDVVLAKDEYQKLLNMAEIKAKYLKEICLAEPLDKLVRDIHRATLAEIIHLHKILGVLETTLDKYLENIDTGGVT